MINEIKELFTTLFESGVRFYYGDEDYEPGEITSINDYKDGYLYITLDEERDAQISLEDFRVYHSKENINLYDWVNVREFDRMIENLYEEGIK